MPKQVISTSGAATAGECDPGVGALRCRVGKGFRGGRAQRSLPLRQRTEVQALSWAAGGGLADGAAYS